MNVTVLPIIELGTVSTAPLSKVMNERLQRFAAELQDIHLKSLGAVEPLFEDVVIYISYNNKYNIRWKIVNDVAESIEKVVAKQCGQLGYIKWKTETVNTFKR